MIDLTLQSIIDSNFKKIEEIKNVTIISDLGTFNYLLLKNKSKNIFSGKVFVIYDRKLYEKHKNKYDQNIFPNAKITHIKNHTKEFNIVFNSENAVLFIYNDLKSALIDHNLNTNYKITL